MLLISSLEYAEFKVIFADLNTSNVINKQTLVMCQQIWNTNLNTSNVINKLKVRGCNTSTSTDLNTSNVINKHFHRQN